MFKTISHQMIYASQLKMISKRLLFDDGNPNGDQTHHPAGLTAAPLAFRHLI